MSVAASINILLKGNTSDFEAKLKTVERKFKSFASAISSGGGMLGSAVRNALQQNFSVDAFKNLFEEVVQLGRVSERLNILPEKLAGIKLAAEATGQSFGEITSGLQKMLVAVSGSGDPLKKAQADVAFNKLKLSAEELKGLAPDEMFMRIADALKNVEDVSDRVNIARSIFGNGGVPILDIIQNGSKGLKELQRAAEQAGLALNKADVEKFEKANIAINVMWARLKGVALTILKELVPYIQYMAKVVVVAVNWFLPFLERWGKVLKYVIELMIVYRAVAWSVVAVERAWAVITAIKAALAEKSYAKIVAAAAGIVGLTAALVIGMNKVLEKIGKAVDEMKDIEWPDLGKGIADAMPDFTGKGVLKNQHPGGLIKGSVEAYSAVVNAGGSAMGQVAKNTQNANKHLLALIAIEQGRKNPRPANLGGGR